MLERIFSGSPADMSRYSVPGLIVMALGVALVAMAGKIGRGRDSLYYACKLGGLLAVMLGAVIAVKLFA